MKYNFTKEQIQEAIANNDSIIAYSEYLKCSRYAFVYYAKKYKLKYKNRKFNVNFNFFDELNSKSIYWLGFLLADGYINKNTIGIDLAQIDTGHLLKFRNDIKSNAKILTRLVKNSERNINWKDSLNSILHIHSKELVIKLAKLGMVQKKSNILQINENIKNSPLINIFVRGYIDGDGGYGYQKYMKTPQPYLRIRGNEQFLLQLQEIINTNCKIDTFQNINFDSGTYSLRYSGINICSKIINWLYSDVFSSNSNLYLDRKYDLIREIVGIK